MADTTKKTTRVKKPAATKTAVPKAKSVAAEAKPQITPAAVKAAVKPAPGPATVAVAKPTVAPAPVAAPTAAKVEQAMISKTERQRRVEQAAYYRAEKNGFQGDSSKYWAEAEAEIEADLKKRGIRVL